ncbi:hypothetical protein AG1IA_07286 [Rhizoctonia solani AG-1 IA]|uniref:Uncharacterized protein n=1 Tax=Thanatephorus cucumeris (strain AG1-IA) TaxID=983506 RepID=L8WQR4_THACA|nr:hypothetical protein AG1IA_07286 [Rhizoctonia solani AG-1 IA]
MAGAVEGPFAPTNSLLAPTPTSGVASSSRTGRSPLSAKPAPPATSNAVRTLTGFGDFCSPPSQLRRMVAGGRKGSPHQNKVGGGYLSAKPFLI